MHSSEPITLTRACEAVEIPAGIPHTLPAGAVVRLMQELGGSYSVIAESGRMYRLNAEDADALGLSVKATEQASASTQGELNEKMIWDQLKTVFDPEIPVNIVDLGLIYDCHLSPLNASRFKADVKMTLTAPGCGMGPMLAQDVQNKLLGLEGVDDVAVELVWDPPWNQSMISEAGKLQLGLL